MPATMNAIVTDGPARSAIAAAVRTKRPAPMMAPMPSDTSANDPRLRLSPPSLLVAPSAMSRSIDLLRNNEPATPFLLSVVKVRRERDVHPRDEGPHGDCMQRSNT